MENTAINKAIIGSRLHPGVHPTMHTCWSLSVSKFGQNRVSTVTFSKLRSTWRTTGPTVW